MGWLFGFGQSRAELVARRTQSDMEQGFKCLRFCTVGNVLWSVWEKAEPDGHASRFIACDLLARDERGSWGYKALSESMGPYYYTCPLAYLEMAPVADEEWRRKVRAYHAARTRKVEIGDILVFSGLAIPQVTITARHKRSFIGVHAGKQYLVRPKHMERVVEQRHATV